MAQVACPACRELVEDSSAYCPYCGATLAASSTPAAAPTTPLPVLSDDEAPVAAASPIPTTMGHDAMSQPPMGQPPMGQPPMGQPGPGMGQPGMGQPGMGQPPMQPAHQPQMGYRPASGGAASLKAHPDLWVGLWAVLALAGINNTASLSTALADDPKAMLILLSLVFLGVAIAGVMFGFRAITEARQGGRSQLSDLLVVAFTALAAYTAVKALMLFIAYAAADYNGFGG